MAGGARVAWDALPEPPVLTFPRWGEGQEGGVLPVVNGTGRKRSDPHPDPPPSEGEGKHRNPEGWGARGFRLSPE